MSRCHYCLKPAVKRGTCSRTPNVGKLDVCGRHLHCVIPPGENIARGRVERDAQ